MIEKIEIKNFKSVADLSFELGRVNVLIGANGTGKSNILEAVAFGGAAAADKLDNEFLASRGIRITEANLMKSGHRNENTECISLYLSLKEDVFRADLDYHDANYPKWENVYYKKGVNIYKLLFENKEAEAAAIAKEDLTERKEIISRAFKVISELTKDENTKKIIFEAVLRDAFMGVSDKEALINFVIFSPENSIIRNFEKEGQIQPLGINGEGLFKLLKVLTETQPEKLQKINEKLRLIEWFDGFDMPTNLIADQAYLKIKDRYLHKTLQNFDQRSSNEGFLFLLFYFTLFIADETPKFFAVDNVDAALNPKLAARLMQELTALSKEHDKQVILTTHNPALLDGLDLTDDEVRLFVVYRSVEGHTTLKRVTRQKPRPGKEQVPLSEAFLRGYIGGLPSNF